MGVCWANSLHRARQLEDNPDIDSADIQLGSSPSTRMRQLKYIKAYEAYDHAKKSDFEVANLQGLPVRSKAELIDLREKQWHHMEEKIQGEYGLQKSNEKKTHLFVSFKNVWGGEKGHAINIQENHELNRFRIIDDNVGIVEFKDYETFKAEFNKLQKLYAPRSTHRYPFERTPSSSLGG